MGDFTVAHACILSLALLTPFTLSPSIGISYDSNGADGSVCSILHVKSNSKLQALINGIPFRRLFQCTSWEDLASSVHCFKHVNAVYVRFCHIANFQGFIWVPPRRLSFVVNILVTENFCKSNKKTLSWPKWRCDFGAAMTTFGCGRLYLSTPTNPPFGLWNRP